MHSILNWITTHWVLVSLIALGLIQVLNAATKHWSNHTGFVKVALFIVELISFFSSRDVPGVLKIPFTSSGPKALIPFVVVIGLLSTSGCCSSARCYLARGLPIIAETDKIALPAIEKACAAEVSKCEKGKPDACPALAKCQTQLTAYRVAMDAIGRALAAANSALATLGVQ